MTEICKGPSCKNPVAVKKTKTCMAHYQQQWKGQEMKPLKERKSRKASDEVCGVVACERTSSSRGLCSSHSSVAWRMSVHPDDLPRVMDTCCEVCGSESRLNIDHDHNCCPGNESCGECLRGVLCNTCNVILGHLEARGALQQEGVAGSKMIAYGTRDTRMKVRRFESVYKTDSHSGRRKKSK